MHSFQALSPRRLLGQDVLGYHKVVSEPDTTDRPNEERSPIMSRLSGIITLCFALVLLSFSRPAAGGEDRDTRMEWWREARFGMFIHWCLYAIPAGEWKGRTNHA
jgi:hypothetical protein